MHYLNSLAANKLILFYYQNNSITIDSFSCSLCVATVSEGYKPESLHAKDKTRIHALKTDFLQQQQQQQKVSFFVDIPQNFAKLRVEN